MTWVIAAAATQVLEISSLFLAAVVQFEFPNIRGPSMDPNSRALIVRTPYKRTPNLQRGHV